MHAPLVTGDRLGVIVGSALADGTLTAGATEQVVDTDLGPARLFEADGAIVVYRHHATPDGYRPPHRVDHHRSVSALCALGCDRVLAIASVGSLRGWPVGTAVAPFDFFAPQVTPSFFEDAAGHSVPGFDEAWRDRVIDRWRALTDTEVMDGGIYAQTTGPRFETPAEVRALAVHADIVGMTIAAECILAGEAGLAYAAVCIVDNLANGIGDQLLTADEFRAGVAHNRARLVADLRLVVPGLTATPRPNPPARDLPAPELPVSHAARPDPPPGR